MSRNVFSELSGSVVRKVIIKFGDELKAYQWLTVLFNVWYNWLKTYNFELTEFWEETFQFSSTYNLYAKMKKYFTSKYFSISSYSLILISMLKKTALIWSYNRVVKPISIMSLASASAQVFIMISTLALNKFIYSALTKNKSLFGFFWLLALTLASAGP